MKRKSNFTLVELAIVIACVAVLMVFVIIGLAAMVIPATGMARGRARTTECTNNKGQLMKSMQIYACDNKGLFIYRGVRGSTPCTYAAVLTGLDGMAKQYAPGDLMVCTSAKQKLNADATNAAGILNATGTDDLTSVADAQKGWLNESDKYGEKIYKRFGRFADSRDGKTVVYDFERTKAPGQLLIFADTFKRGSGETEANWNFIPNDKSNGDFCVTLIHGSQTVGVFADGHAEAMDAERLKDCGTEVTVFNDHKFKKDRMSAR